MRILFLGPLCNMSFFAFGWQRGKKNLKMDKPALMERLLSLLSSSPEASETLNQFLTFYASSGRQFSDLGDFVLSGNHEYSKLLLGAMEYSIFPHGVRPKLATLAGITSKDTAWDWVTSQIKTFVERNDWMHAQHLPKIAHAFSRIFFTIARAKFPI